MKEANPMCYFCKEPHPIDHKTRQKVILTTSAVFDVHFLKAWTWHGEKPTHCDVEGVPDGPLSVCRKAWERGYCCYPLPIDTVVVAGLEHIRTEMEKYDVKSVGMDKIAEEISDNVVDELKALHRTIQEHSKKHDVKDTLAVATLMHVPAMYWRDSDGVNKAQDYINFKNVIDRTNLKIEAFNLEFGQSNAPKIHQFCERGRAKRREYQWNMFVEEKTRTSLSSLIKAR